MRFWRVVPASLEATPRRRRALDQLRPRSVVSVRSARETRRKNECGVYITRIGDQ